MHVEERLSYRVIAKRVKERLGKPVSPKLACRMVNEIARMSKSSVEIRREYEPRWSGYLTTDDKWVPVHGNHELSLVAVDGEGDPLHSELQGEQTQEVFDNFFLYLRDRLGYPFKAITTDFDQRWDKAIGRVLSPDFPHQKCLWHALEIVKGLIDYPQTRRRYRNLMMQIKQLRECLVDRKQSVYDCRDRLVRMEQAVTVLTQEYQDKKLLLERLHALLFASDRALSDRLWRSFRRLYQKRYLPVIRFVTTHWEALLQHQDDPKIFKTTVRAENINKQLQRRYKTIEAFQSIDTAFHYQNLYRNYLRFKPYTDCRGRRRRNNGLSPLQVCGAIIHNADWLKNAVRTP
jgi:hypothetical protein